MFSAIEAPASSNLSFRPTMPMVLPAVRFGEKTEDSIDVISTQKDPRPFARGPKKGVLHFLRILSVAIGLGGPVALGTTAFYQNKLETERTELIEKKYIEARDEIKELERFRSFSTKPWKEDGVWRIDIDKFNILTVKISEKESQLEELIGLAFLELKENDSDSTSSLFASFGLLYYLLLTPFFLNLGSVAKKLGRLPKVIKPQELWADLHARGIKGQGVKIGVIDGFYEVPSGLPGSPPKIKNLTYYDARDLEGPQSPLPNEKQKIRHANATLQLISEGCPESEIVFIRREVRDESYSKEAYDDDMEKLDSHTDEAFSEILRDKAEDNIEKNINIGKSIKKLVDEGCQVINISLSRPLGFEEEIIEVKNQLFKFKALQWRGEKIEIKDGKFYRHNDNGVILRIWNFNAEGPAFVDRTDLTPEETALKQKQERLLKLLKKAQKALLDTDLTANNPYQHWVDALEYANEKGVMVVIGAANEGARPLDVRQSQLEQTNLHTLFDSPNLFLVGSTNADGEMSGWTSELSNRIKPTNAANGDKEIWLEGLQIRPIEKNKTDPKGKGSKNRRPLGERLAKHFDKSPYGELYSGTSCAAPDETVALALMKCQNPDITIEQIREAVTRTASPAQFKPFEGEKVLKDVLERLNFLELLTDTGQGPSERYASLLPQLSQEQQAQVAFEMEGEISRRVGAGMLNRLAAVETAHRIVQRDAS